MTIVTLVSGCGNAYPFPWDWQVTYSSQTSPVSCRSIWSLYVTTDSGVLHCYFCGLKAGTRLDTRLAWG